MCNLPACTSKPCRKNRTEQHKISKTDGLELEPGATADRAREAYVQYTRFDMQEMTCAASESSLLPTMQATREQMQASCCRKNMKACNDEEDE